MSLRNSDAGRSAVPIRQTGRFAGVPAPVVASLSFSDATADGYELVSIFGEGFGLSFADVRSVQACGFYLTDVVDSSSERAKIDGKSQLERLGTGQGAERKGEQVVDLVEWRSPAELAVLLPPGLNACPITVTTAADVQATAPRAVVRASPVISLASPRRILAGSSLSEAPLTLCGEGIIPSSWDAR